MEEWKWWKIVEYQKTSLKTKNCQILYKTKTVSHLKEVIQPPPTHSRQIKPYYVFETKNFLPRYTEMYRHSLSKCFKNAGSWASRNGAVQMFFLAPNRNMCARIFAKSERFLALLPEHFNFNFEWVEVRAMSEVFWGKLYCKMSDLFR